MQLEKIKLSGFKSFVDPTIIPIKGNLIAIVGPNGCGKSNIIDAVRWVMGESSAKHLRGGSMADVIFNGSTSRKPVSIAAVELVFDNSAGRAGGEFAKFNTISIKRQVSRDGQSVYVLNGTRCRRKDITDLFLGTGLGARSYAIIEQGTISRMVEAKPEELRIHIEEAAGISKYKERRHETETRMRHTRENLERLDDLREEVEKQLKHLQKQAHKAEKYTELKKQERQCRLELLAMRWQAYHLAAEALEQKLQDAAEQHNQLFIERKQLDESIDQQRAEHKQQQQQLELAQGDYYHAVAEVSRLEQAIKHNERSQQEARLELQRLREQSANTLTAMDADQIKLEEIKKALLENDDLLAAAKALEADVVERQQATLQSQHAWQQQWDEYRTMSADYREQMEVKKSTILQLENQAQHLQNRMQRLEEERSTLSAGQLQKEIEVLDQVIESLDSVRADKHQQLEALYSLIRELRQQVKQHHDALHGSRSESQTIKGKITSLELLQQHAMEGQ